MTGKVGISTNSINLCVSVLGRKLIFRIRCKEIYFERKEQVDEQRYRGKVSGKRGSVFSCNAENKTKDAPRLDIQIHAIVWAAREKTTRSPRSTAKYKNSGLRPLSIQ